MRLLPLGVLSTLALALSACSTTPTLTSPAQTADPTIPALGAVIQTDSQLQAALGIYHLDIDPASLSGNATLVATRSGAANDDLYLLPIDNFLRPNSLEITGIGSTLTTIDLTYTFAHPFAAPSNLAGPPTAANRADLGVAAAMLILADQPTPTGNTFFTDRIINTALVQNPDFYWDPGALIPPIGLTANLFPVQMLVDESGSDGNRIGVSNGGDPSGNFGNDGWTQAELTFSPDNWSGFGVLHQGQKVQNTLSLSKAEINTLGGFSFDVAILAKYNDPRGGTTGAEKRANRLPPAIPDASRFAYRMPHGAWDVSRIAHVDSGDPYVVGQFGASYLSFRVEDFDARAIETSVGDLSGDIDVTTVAVGESGVPSVSVSLPGVIGDTTEVDDFVLGASDDDSAFGGDAGIDSGRPGDALFFREAAESGPTGPAAGGTYKGLVRVTDPEVVTIGDPAFIVELDGNLTPLSSGFPAPIAYQSFEAEAEVPVTNNGFAKRFGANTGDEGHGIAVDSTGNIYVGGRFTSIVDFGGGPRDAGGGSSDYQVVLLKLDANGDYLWDHTWGEDSFGKVERIDGIVVDANDDVAVTGWAGPTTVVAGTPLTITGFTDVVIAKFNGAGTLQWVRNFGPPTTSNSAQGMDIDVDRNTNAVYTVGYYYTTIVPPGGAPMTSLGSSDGFLVKYNSGGTFAWSKSIGANNTSPYSDSAEAVAVDTSGNVFVAGRCSNNVDFGGGVSFGGAHFDGYLVRYSSAGVYGWERRIQSSGTEWCLGVAAGTDRVAVAGFFGGTVDLGGGFQSTTGTNDMFVGVYNAGGLFLWDQFYGSAGQDWGRAISVDPATSEVYLYGAFTGPIDFGSGTRTNAGRDLVVVKFNSTGTYLWDSTWGGASTDDYGDITLNASGHPYMTGYFSGSNVDFEPGPGVSPLSSAGSNDIFVQKLLKTTGGW